MTDHTEAKRQYAEDVAQDVIDDEECRQYRHDMVDALWDGELELNRVDGKWIPWSSYIKPEALRKRLYRRKPKTISGWFVLCSEGTIASKAFPTKEAAQEIYTYAEGFIYLDNVEIQQ